MGEVIPREFITGTALMTSHN